MRVLATRFRHRASSLALVLTFLLSQFAGVLHLATERHEVCADHGELVHLDAEHGVAHASEPTADPHTEVEGPVIEGLVATDADRPGEHAHCQALPAVEPQRELARGGDGISLTPPELAVRAACRAAQRQAAVPLLLQAPKLSPPA